MQNVLVNGLDGIGDGARTIALVVFVAVNLFYVGGVVLKRSSGFVDRWTSTWLATNILALALGTGVPMATGLLKLALGGSSSPLQVQSVTTK
ncbi:MAG: hypothetical protein ABI765_02515 [Gemmatimonadota bacterium]